MPTLTETADATAGIGTAYVMNAGDYFFGTLTSGTESDWIAVDLVAGQTYTFGLAGVGALDDSLDDPYLRLRDASGALLSLDDDDGPGIYSSLTFTAVNGGTYYLDVQSWNTSPGGDYGLSVATGSKASYDVTMGAGALLRSDASWAAGPGTPVTVTWGVRASGPAEDASGNPVPFVSLTAAQTAAAQTALSMFSSVSGLGFSQVNPGGTTNSATMLFGAYDSGADGAGAYAYFPGSTASSAHAGDVWLNNNSVSQTSLPAGSFSQFAILHEIGHAVGLTHPGDYDAGPGVSITYANNAQFLEDTHQYTVMSYFDETNTTGSFSGYPDTLLMYDIYALQQLYGINAAHNAGNSVYGFNSNVGGVFDFSTNAIPVVCIWDGAGIDTLDVSGYGMAQVIDLRDGRFSDIGGRTDNVSIAIGAVIENAVGGSGADSITGNAVNNDLRGNAGNDMLLGHAGNDTIFGGSGHDTLQGGNQEDHLYGGGWNDLIYGGAGFDLLDGGDGNDTLDGGQQADNLWGGAGNDVMLGGGGFDRLFGQTGDDIGYGGDGPDALYGMEDNDRLYGQDGDDRFWGGIGNDLLDGGADDDVLNGGAGFDTLIGSTGNDRLTGNFNADTFVFADFGGGFGQDTITDFDANNDFEKIDLSRVSGIADFTDLVNNRMNQVGAHVVIDDGSGNTITLLNVDLGDLLDGNDFIF